MKLSWHAFFSAVKRPFTNWLPAIDIINNLKTGSSRNLSRSPLMPAHAVLPDNKSFPPVMKVESASLVPWGLVLIKWFFLQSEIHGK